MPIRKRLYVDGLWLSHQACETSDPSINWLDVATLARRVGCADPVNACYFGICDPEDPASEAPVRALAQALEAAGVVCHIRREPSQTVECGRCGHGWEHAPTSLWGADLALQVAEDAACDEIDEAVLLADGRSIARIERLFQRCYPGKGVRRLKPDLADLRQLHLGRALRLTQGATLLRPACWSPPLRRGPSSRGARIELP